MAHQAKTETTRIGLFLNPAGQRRVDFQQSCGGHFSRLFLADGTENANDLLLTQPVDLLVIDLDRFDRGLDLEAIGSLVAQRAGAPTLVICAINNAGWLADLMAFGAIEYVIGPLEPDALGEVVAAQFLRRASAPVTPREEQLRELLAVRAGMQQALADIDDVSQVADQLCAAVCRLPGVVHVSLFTLKGGSDLQLEAQYADGEIDVTRILHRGERLLQSPLRNVFPGLMTACTGEIAFLDSPEKAGEPELVLSLLDAGVQMVLGLPLGGAGAARPRGALCLMFDRREKLSPDQLAAMAGLAQLTSFGLRMAEMTREGEYLMARLTHMATTDALTGVANRRHGEALLELEMKRARRYKVPLALIAFNIDHFRAINDQFGHPVGDAVLRTVAEVTLAVLRSSDVLVRSGGEEFQILAPHTSAIDGLKMAEKVRLAISRADFPGCDRLTVSMGVAQAGDHETGDALTLRADAALRRAKRAGRNCVELAML